MEILQNLQNVQTIAQVPFHNNPRNRRVNKEQNMKLFNHKSAPGNRNYVTDCPDGIEFVCLYHNIATSTNNWNTALPISAHLVSNQISDFLESVRLIKHRCA